MYFHNFIIHSTLIKYFHAQRNNLAMEVKKSIGYPICVTLIYQKKKNPGSFQHFYKVSTRTSWLQLHSCSNNECLQLKRLRITLLTKSRALIFYYKNNAQHLYSTNNKIWPSQNYNFKFLF